MLRKIRLIIFIFVAIFGVVGFVFSVNASNTNGTIDSTNKYAWGSKIGWINFGATNGNVAITDSAITGYTWNDVYGWINLSPTNSGVSNDGGGNLSGSAWGEKLGWINFSGAIIDSSGVFTGTATGTNVGTINFDCANCNVQTDWRPQSVRPQCNNTTDDDGDGLTDYPNDPSCISLADDSEDAAGVVIATYQGSPSVPAPQPSFIFLINNDEEITESLDVVLKLNGNNDVAYVLLSEDPNLNFPTRLNYILENGQTTMSAPFVLSGGEDIKTIYGRFCNRQNKCGIRVLDSILYREKGKLVTTTLEAKDKEVVEKKDAIGKSIEFTKKIFDSFSYIAKSFLPEFLKSFVKEQEKKIELPELVSEQPPLAMKGSWELIPSESIKRYVFAPLPEEFRALAKKFPDVKEFFNNVGVARLNDLRKLEMVQIDIPGLSRSIGLSSVSLGLESLGLPKTIPVGKLSDALKSKIPTEVVFTRGVNQLVDFNSVLSLTVDGRPQQRIAAISGKKLHLSIKPQYQANSVKGYILFKNRKSLAEAHNISLFSIFNSLTFAQPVFAYSVKDLEIEERLLLTEFVYNDEDGDGIYTADIQAPVPEGEYEIITVIEYKDEEYGTKIVRLITVIDPEGYIYEKIRGKQLRISGAIVSLHWLNTKEKKYQLWPAKEYQQENLQITDVRGSYSFLVPEGMYYLQVDAPGYISYIGKPFNVSQGGGVHFNIEMKSMNWWIKFLDWRTGLLVFLTFLIAYNFYKDKRRDGKKNKHN